MTATNMCTNFVGKWYSPPLLVMARVCSGSPDVCHLNWEAVLQLYSTGKQYSSCIALGSSTPAV